LTFRAFRDEFAFEKQGTAVDDQAGQFAFCFESVELICFLGQTAQLPAFSTARLNLTVDVVRIKQHELVYGGRSGDNW